MKKAKVCQYHLINDCIGQMVVNRGYEKAWKEGKSKPSRKEFNDGDWIKLAGNNPYKGSLPKYDEERGSPRRLEKLIKGVIR